MPQAAVPAYVGQDFSECPPGHRFNLYFRVWNTQWDLDRDDAKAAALRDVRRALPKQASELLGALAERQLRAAQTLPETQRVVIDAKSSAPFATGLGLEHPIENGFSFLSPYGLPYLAGSGVKGVLRRAAEELYAEGEPGITQDVVNALFGPEDGAADGSGSRLPDEQRRRGALSCWDVLPRFTAMALEIMTPHQSHYLQDVESPHDSGKPNPIAFLALPAGSDFRFIMTFEPSLVPGGSRDALTHWQAVVERIACHAFEWLGFGAKTAVGYGAMFEDEEARRQREQAAAQRQAEAEMQRKVQLRLAMSAADAELDEVRPVIEQFTAELGAERQLNRYKPGQGGFDDKRAAFLKLALTWQHEPARRAAAQVLRDSYKFTNWPSKKERKQEVKQALTALDGQA